MLRVRILAFTVCLLVVYLVYLLQRMWITGRRAAGSLVRSLPASGESRSNYLRDDIAQGVVSRYSLASFCASSAGVAAVMGVYVTPG